MEDKPAIYLTDPAEMLKARLSQPHQTSEQARLQRERLARAAEASAQAAKAATSSRGRTKTRA